MKKCFMYIFLFSTFLIFGCESNIENEEFVANWINEEEQCRIELNKDLTFSAKNLPLDVQNQYLLLFDKGIKEWEGTWSIENEQVRLIFDNSYYNLYIDNPVFFGSPVLYIQLLEESGGSFIYLDKK